MEGLGPWAVMRGATFDCGLAVVAEVAALPVADVLLAALLLLGDELHPVKLIPIATTANVITVLASVRFIALAPVGWALRHVRESTRWRAYRQRIAEVVGPDQRHQRIQCPASNSMGKVAGPEMPISGFHGAGPLRRGLGIRRVMTVRASASSALARCAPRQ